MRNRFLKFTSSFLVPGVPFSSINSVSAQSETSVKAHIFRNKFIPLYLFSVTAGISLLFFLVKKYISKSWKFMSIPTTKDLEAELKGLDNILNSLEPEIKDSKKKIKTVGNTLDSLEPTTQPDKTANGGSKNNDKFGVWKIFKKLIINFYTSTFLIFFVFLPYWFKATPLYIHGLCLLCRSSHCHNTWYKYHH